MAMQYVWISELKPGDNVHYMSGPARVVQVVQGVTGFALVLDRQGTEVVYEGLAGDKEILRIEPDLTV